ncbi:hypothetical protein BH23PAT1_BH23PAT1_4470 [soil metagenome]
MKIIQSDQEWDKLQSSLDASFLQSSAWAKFQSVLPAQSFRLNGEGWTCLLIKKRSRFWTYLFAPYGPTLGKEANLVDALRSITAFAKENKIDWLRLEPTKGISTNSDLSQQLKKAGATPAVRSVNPSLTRIVDISAPEEALLSSISSSTRTFIRKNDREPVLTYKTSYDPDDMKHFVEMLGEVSARNNVNFRPDSATYYTKQAQALMPSKNLRLEIALKDNKPVACAVMHDLNKTTTYAYAASYPEARKYSASALLLWQAIKNAKKLGIENLDLFGIAPREADKSHPWYGFTAFKEKFGGEVISHGGTWDVPLTYRYRIYRTLLMATRLIAPK